MTKFKMRDMRADEISFRDVSRKVYRTAARVHDEAGLPVRTGTEYHDGQPVKFLTLMRKNSE